LFNNNVYAWILCVSYNESSVAIRVGYIYTAIKECHAEAGYPIEVACKLLHVARSAYHKWVTGKLSSRFVENDQLANKIEQIHTENPDKGYRRINDDLRHDHGIHINDKRVLRICRSRDIKSTIKYENRGCTRKAKNPQYLAENLLDRQFHSSKPNEKWLTDVTEFKWYEGFEVHKVYLSAILDLYDRRIVSFVTNKRNDNPLVFKTFDKAVKENPDAHPLFHSDRGCQYTNRDFHHKLEKAGMTQSMSRVARCIDNGPMEGFWGILKRERYYGKRFTSKQELIQMIENYIRYYNTRRVQRNLGVLTPFEKHNLYLAA
jgi:transposase InsO family protein